MSDENTDAGNGASQLRRRTLLVWLLPFVFAAVVSLFLLKGNLNSALKPLETPIAKGQKVRIGFLPEVRSETFEATLPVPVDWR